MTAMMADVSTVSHRVGPYTLIEVPGGWWLTYLESQEDLDSWEDLLVKFPDFGQASTVSEIASELETGDGTETLVLSRWAP